MVDIIIEQGTYRIQLHTGDLLDYYNYSYRRYLSGKVEIKCNETQFSSWYCTNKLPEDIEFIEKKEVENNKLHDELSDIIILKGDCQFIPNEGTHYYVLELDDHWFLELRSSDKHIVVKCGDGEYGENGHRGTVIIDYGIFDPLYISKASRADYLSALTQIRLKY